MNNNTENKIQKDLEAIFDKYKFTKDQRMKAVADLIQAGEALTIEELKKTMSDEKKSQLEEYLASIENQEDKLKKIYVFLSETCGTEKVNEIHNHIYDKLVEDYIAHMNS